MIKKTLRIDRVFGGDRTSRIAVAIVAASVGCSSDPALPTQNVPAPVDSLAAPANFPSLVGQIAFTSTRDGSDYIYVAAADGSSLRRLAAGVNPAWSWDGQPIAFNGIDSTSAPPISWSRC